MEEAEMVADYIINGGDKEAFMKHFENAYSKGFDPDTMLDKVGLANQTTMYKKETRAIGQLFQKTMMQKFGPVDVATHYMEFDTICDATQVRDMHAISVSNHAIIRVCFCLFAYLCASTNTFGRLFTFLLQERQDAIHEMVENVEKDGLDFILVIGGFDSSNTAHLLEIPVHAGVRAFHIDRAQCIGADNTITHRLISGETVTEPFLLDMDKEVIMGVTSGASTPDAAVQDSLSQIFLLKSMHDAASK
jgi:4-hydroxy-3-methylbut-2-enyl diphosphate reductase